METKLAKDSQNNNYLMTESGTCYNKGTDKKVIETLENNLWSNRSYRIRVWYGEDGESWDEENDIVGYVGRSTGNYKIPLLINNSGCYGGGTLLTHCIVKIVKTDTKSVLYQHPNFKQGHFTAHPLVNQDKDKEMLLGYFAKVLRNKETYAFCRTLEKAIRLSDFMNGKRMNK